MAGNCRRSRSRWDNAADVAQALRVARKPEPEEPPQTRRLLRFQKHPVRRRVAWESWFPFRELLVSFCGGSFLPASAHALLTEKRKLRLQSCLSWTTLWAGGENGSAHPDHFDEAARRIP
jgi:hypothetical protein